MRWGGGRNPPPPPPPPPPSPPPPPPPPPPLWETVQGAPLPTLKEIETLEETSTHDVKLKKGEEYVETCEDDKDDVYEFDSDYSERNDC